MPHIQQHPGLHAPARERIRFKIDHIGRTSSSIAEAAARLTDAFPQFIVHGDQEFVGVHTKLTDFDGASGRLGKIGVCLGGVRERR